MQPSTVPAADAVRNRYNFELIDLFEAEIEVGRYLNPDSQVDDDTKAWAARTLQAVHLAINRHLDLQETIDNIDPWSRGQILMALETGAVSPQTPSVDPSH